MRLVRCTLDDLSSADKAYYRNRSFGGGGRCVLLQGVRHRPRRQAQLTPVNWDLQHSKSSFVIRSVLAVWIRVVIVVLCATGRWWGLAFIAPLVLDLYLLRRVVAAGRTR